MGTVVIPTDLNIRFNEKKLESSQILEHQLQSPYYQNGLDIQYKVCSVEF